MEKKMNFEKKLWALRIDVGFSLLIINLVYILYALLGVGGLLAGRAGKRLSTLFSISLITCIFVLYARLIKNEIENWIEIESKQDNDRHDQIQTTRLGKADI